MIAVAIGLLWSGASAQEVLPTVPNKAALVDARSIEGAPGPRWPDQRHAPDGAPNIVLIMTDDIGFAASSTFGGPIATPTLDALARDGLRYNEFNTTALCSPTRAALLTGRNPHRVGMARTENHPLGFPGYDTVIPKSAGMISEILRQHGYSTAAFGKWHLTPEWEQSLIGPFDRWPTGEGFEYYYGFIGADTSQWDPSLIENTRPVSKPANDPDYILDRDLADHAIQWLHQQNALAPNRPFFLYYATGTAHAPNHAPKAWIDKYRGKFDQGWDKLREESFRRQKVLGVIPADAKLTPRPDIIPPWSSLSEDQKHLYAHMMEVYAGAIAYMDSQVGRLIAELRKSGEWRNTVVIFIEGDNGSSGEGGPNGRLFEQSAIAGQKEDFDYMLTRKEDLGGPSVYGMVPTGWGWAMNTPFRWFKRASAHFGGIRNGMVICWPDRIKDRGGIRSQFHYITDIAPTILDMVGVEEPKVLNGVPQMSVDGISMTYTFDDAAASTRRHNQVMEMLASWGIYRDGWLAAAPFETDAFAPPAVNNSKWELYDLSKDFSQADNVAVQHPERLQTMETLFWQEARENQILPIVSLATSTRDHPSLGIKRTTFVYPAGVNHVSEDAAPPVVNRSFSIQAKVEIPEHGGDGVIVAQGGRFGGYSLFVKGGHLVFYYNAVDPHHYSVQSTQVLAPGQHEVGVDFDYDGPGAGRGGTATLKIDGEVAGQGKVGQTLGKWLSHTEGLDIGEDAITAVAPDYSSATSVFSGTIEEVKFTIR
ncbi:MAG: sulfatase-like hydrolase/transferase [Alphaproteobacteria bacterium]|nr:sulfatase-like hydrolase/transferase [Alphaproteobacteria bacterium]